MGENLCAVCHLPSEKRCSACGNVVYCSSQHQKLDWKNHKIFCNSYKICNNDKFGRHLVATRNISEGTVLILEEPIIVGPKLYSLPICLGCYVRVDGSYFCTKCGFPMCSVQCQNVPAHRDNECSIFQKKGSTPKNIANYDIAHPLYQSILPLRCLLLMTKCPEKWTLINTMESHLETRKRCSEVWDENQVNTVNFLREWHGLKTDYTEDTVNRVIGFIEVNSFQIKTVKKIEICGLFKLGAMMCHDCTPNTHHAFTEEGNLILRSSIKIPKNSVITMSYVDPLMGTMERRQMLQQSKYFSCDCRRCQDPTEFGTFMSGIKCNCENSDGYLLPMNSLDLHSNWVCYTVSGRNSKCNTFMTVQEVEAKLKLIGTEIDALPSGTIENLENIISCYAKNILHTNHFLLLPLWKQFDIFYEVKLLETKTIDLLLKHKEITGNLLNIFNILYPGLTRGRGVLLHQMYKLNQEIQKFQFKNGEISQSDYTDSLEKSQVLKLELEKLFELDRLIGVKN